MYTDISDTQSEIDELYAKLGRIKHEIAIRKTFIEELQSRIDNGQYIKEEGE